MCEMSFLEPYSQTQIRAKKLCLRSFWHIFKVRERPSYPEVLQQVKPGSTGDKKAISGMAPSSISLEEKLKKSPITGQGHVTVFGTVKEDSCGCDAKRGDSQL
jgi:hypothetical protein